MNQSTNLIAFGLLTKEQQAQFSFEAKEKGMYEVYGEENDWCPPRKGSAFAHHLTYHLKILPDEWYYGEYYQSGSVVDKGVDFYRPLKDYTILRPAKPSEIPKPEPTLLERIEEAYPDKDVMILEWKDDTLHVGDYVHVRAQSMKGFAGYVYEDDDHLIFNIYPVRRNKGETGFPIAVLFNK